MSVKRGKYVELTRKELEAVAAFVGASVRMIEPRVLEIAFPALMTANEKIQTAVWGKVG